MAALQNQDLDASGVASPAVAVVAQPGYRAGAARLPGSAG